MNNKCPSCSNHCDKDNLKCRKGQEYFKQIINDDSLSTKEKIICNFPKHGHSLHHNKNITSKLPLKSKHNNN